jgi:hypothetical protein
MEIAESGDFVENGSTTPNSRSTQMTKLIPLALLAGLFLASCDCLSDICGCCDEGETTTEAPADD